MSGYKKLISQTVLHCIGNRKMQGSSPNDVKQYVVLAHEMPRLFLSSTKGYDDRFLNTRVATDFCVEKEKQGKGMYAMTYNIQPHHRINKKPWRMYTHENQRSILLRQESNYRKKTPSVTLLEVHLEVCPVVGNIHMHALYQMSDYFAQDMHTYFTRIGRVPPDAFTVQPWRPIVIKSVDDADGWIDYIRKDATDF